MNKRKLTLQIIVRLAMMIPIMGVLLFWPAGTLDYWQGWAYIAAFFVPTVVVTLLLLAREPALIERRLKWREPERRQRIGQSVLGALFIGGYLLAGFDRRFGWSHVPAALSIISCVIVSASYFIIYRAMRDNPYAASTVEVEDGQQVITTGIYSLVRHPMYMGVLPLIAFTPLALGSYWALLAFLPIVIGVILRLLNEEEVLLRDLPGYAEYCQQVRWRLLPGVW